MRHNLAFLAFLLFSMSIFPIDFLNTNHMESTYVKGIEEEKQKNVFDEDNGAAEMELANLQIESVDVYTPNGEKTLVLQKGKKYNLQVNLSNLSDFTGISVIVATFYDENLVPISTNSSIVEIIPNSRYSVSLRFTIVDYSYVGIGTLRLNLLTKSIDEGGVSYGSEYVKSIMITQ